MAFTFNKEERLCSRAIIAGLFEKGNCGFTQFPFRFIWKQTPLPSPFPVQVLFAASKRNYPKANQRNRIKRQLRELYRLKKHLLYLGIAPKQVQYALMISYTGKEKLPHAALEKSFTTAINRLLKEIEKDHHVSVHRPDQGI